MRILLAEDDQSVGNKVQDLLLMAGHNVVRAHSGQEAFARFETEPFPLIITSLTIPGLSGFELCRQVRKRMKAEFVYIIVLVSSGREFDFQEAKAADVDDVLPVPVETDILLARLRVAERMLNLYDELDRLHRLIPVCSYCKKVRQEEGIWQQMEFYIAEHSHASFSHGICPECAKKEFPEHIRSDLKEEDPSIETVLPSKPNKDEQALKLAAERELEVKRSQQEEEQTSDENQEYLNYQSQIEPSIEQHDEQQDEENGCI